MLSVSDQSLDTFWNAFRERSVLPFTMCHIQYTTTRKWPHQQSMLVGNSFDCSPPGARLPYSTTRVDTRMDPYWVHRSTQASTTFYLPSGLWAAQLCLDFKCTALCQKDVFKLVTEKQSNNSLPVNLRCTPDRLPFYQICPRWISGCSL